MTDVEDARIAYKKLTNSTYFDSEGNCRHLADAEIMIVFDRFFGLAEDAMQPVAYQELDLYGIPQWGENTFSYGPGQFEFERPLYSARGIGAEVQLTRLNAVARKLGYKDIWDMPEFIGRQPD